MTARLFETLTFIDPTTGEPMTSGSIYTYIAGSTTPQNAYTDNSAATPLPNPVPLNSAGQPTNNLGTVTGLWLHGSYKLVGFNGDGQQVFVLDNVTEYDLYDWTGLTVTPAQINSAVSTGTPGLVVANKAVVVDSTKSASTFGTLTAANFIANTSVSTPAILDANGAAAVTITSVPSQVNAVTITPASTGSSPTIAATGSDTNINLSLSGKGTGGVLLGSNVVVNNTYTLPTTTGSANQVLTFPSSGTQTTWSTPSGVVLLGRAYASTATVVTASTTFNPNTASAWPTSSATLVTTLSYTPSSLSNLLLGRVCLSGTCTTANTNCAAGLFISSIDGTNMAYAQVQSAGGTAAAGQLNITGLFSYIPTSLADQQIKLYVAPAAGTFYVSGTSSGAAIGGVARATIQVEEFSS